MATVKVRSTGGLQQKITAGRHAILADEPETLGGSDSGLNPYELLLGALGACKCMTVLLYARRREWPLESVEVELTHSQSYAKQCEECPEKPVRLDRIEVKLTLNGSLDEAQRQRLHEIANRCPVHQTLSHQVQIVDKE